jgi:hypothetical protein
MRSYPLASELSQNDYEETCPNRMLIAGAICHFEREGSASAGNAGKTDGTGFGSGESLSSWSHDQRQRETR